MNMYPDAAEFCRLAAGHNIVPVYTELLTDLETPVSLYYKLVGEEAGFMLESADSSKNFGRYSFLGADPFAEIKSYAGYSEVTQAGISQRVEGSPTEVIGRFISSFSFPAMADLPPFSGGGVGYFAYEAVSTWERVRGLAVPADMVLAELLFCQVIIVMDHLTHSTRLIYLARMEDDADPNQVYQAAEEKLAALLDKLRQPFALPGDAIPAGRIAAHDFIPSAAVGEKYLQNVAAAKEHILAGDIFQVVLSQQFCRPLQKHPFALYRRLRQINPSPYMFYINFGKRKLVGASPEMLVKLDGDDVYTFPIAGTRPRGKDAGEDQAMAEELLADTKEIAEHAMLVDLGRNDLGRISIPGTVRVKRMMEIEKFSHVMHMVSEVTGKINPAYTALDALQACFPAGTVSGAPKVRAMEIIHQLEEEYRGPYAGAVGYLDFQGGMDTCIAIRTMIVDGEMVTVQTGAGIVADSVPEKEFQEVLHKARVLFQVIGEGET